MEGTAIVKSDFGGGWALEGTSASYNGQDYVCDSCGILLSTAYPFIGVT
jgi:hypothetical protein